MAAGKRDGMPRRLQRESSTSAIVGKIFKITIVAWFVFLLAVPICHGQVQQGQQNPQHAMQERARELLQNVQNNPRDAEARFMLGWFFQQIGNNKWVEVLQSCFDSTAVDQILGPQHPIQAFVASSLLGRYFCEQKDTDVSIRYLTIAYNISMMMSPSKEVAELCTHLQLATQLDSYPLSNKAVDQSLERIESEANKILYMFDKKHPDLYINEQWMGQSVPGFASDPYIHCMISLFPLSFYYRADVAKVANHHFKLASLAFPKLLHTAKFVAEWDQQQRMRASVDSDGNHRDDEGGHSSVVAPLRTYPDCVDRKIKLGVISSTLSKGHSVAEDFGGILQRLDRSLFDVTFIYVHEKPNLEDGDDFLTANPEDKLLHYQKKDDENFDGAWVRRIGYSIEELEFDMIFYPDLTMGTIVRRLGMERLAPVQLNSHGHPVTSGHPREIIQHFVSWAEAELPYEESKTHYTEELQLIPKGKLHQYYTPRVLKNSYGVRYSRMTGLPFDEITRNDFPQLPSYIKSSTPDDDHVHLYVCMQKPFKIFPEFDELLCGILQKDPKGHAILHDDKQRGRFVHRMETAGCDMSRVHFVPPQPSHRLLALYKTSTVILDSYPAGGCTTTREALELGKPVVTWPARLLGGRWTLGLYNIIGISEESKSKLIAASKEEYISKAVELGTNRSARALVEDDIRKAIPSLFGRKEAVEEWEKIFLRVSPVKHCAGSKETNYETNEL